MKTIIGFYNRSQYSVRIVDGNNYEEIYKAGNSLDDSQTFINPNDSRAASLKQMKQFCAKTSQDIAKEKGLTYAGVQFEEE